MTIITIRMAEENSLVKIPRSILESVVGEYLMLATDYNPKTGNVSEAAVQKKGYHILVGETLDNVILHMPVQSSKEVLYRPTGLRKICYSRSHLGDKPEFTEDDKSLLSTIEDDLLERPFYALVINISQLAAQICTQHNKQAKDLLLGATDEERQEYAEMLDAIRKREGYTNKESHAGKFIGEAVSIIMNNIPKYVEMYNVKGKKMDFVIK